jgi:hypothetical protein
MSAIAIKKLIIDISYALKMRAFAHYEYKLSRAINAGFRTLRPLLLRHAPSPTENN